MSKPFKVNERTSATFRETGHVSISQADPINGSRISHVILEVGELQAIITAYFNQREDADA